MEQQRNELLELINSAIVDCYVNVGLQSPTTITLEMRKNLVFCDVESVADAGNFVSLVLSLFNREQKLQLTMAFQKLFDSKLRKLCRNSSFSIKHIVVLPHESFSTNSVRKQICIILEENRFLDDNEEIEWRLQFSKLVKSVLKRGVKHLYSYNLRESGCVCYYFEGYLNSYEKEFACSMSLDKIYSSWHEYYLSVLDKAANKLHNHLMTKDSIVNIRLEPEKNIGVLVVDGIKKCSILGIDRGLLLCYNPFN